MDNYKRIIIIICGLLIIIGVFLPWWTVKDLFLGYTITENFNPIFGTTYIPTTPLIVISGILSLIGGVLIFIAYKWQKYGILGGSLAILGLVLFIIAFYTEDLGNTIVPGETLGLFDHIVVGFHDLSTFLGFGWYLTLTCTIIGVIVCKISD